MSTSVVTPTSSGYYDADGNWVDTSGDNSPVGFGPTAPGSTTGLGSLTPDLSSGQLGVASSAATDSTTAALQSDLGALTKLGYSIASAATGRPVVTSGGVTTLGNAPTMVGQININTIFLYAVVAFVAYILLKEAA